MSRDFQEGFQDASPEEFSDELKGVILDEDESHQQRIWIGGGVAILLLLITFSWTYLFAYQTPEEKLRQQLQDRTYLRQLLSTSARTLRLPFSSTGQMKSSLEDVIKVASTGLRISTSSQAPYIPERELAMIEAIEALLRLEIEGIIHPENPKDREFFETLVHQLGLLELEYYDRGILERVPLSMAAKLEHDFKKEEQLLGDYAPSSTVLTDLRARLQKAHDEESGTIVGYALLLGKWFRYHNDMNHAERCFEIGRKYCEGYRRNQTHYSGKKPDKLCPLWTEYVSCIEALAERHMKEQNYRQARSLLVRIFNTPQNNSSNDSGKRSIKYRKNREAKISKLQHDIEALKAAVQDPLNLPSYPHYSLADENIHLSRIAAQLLRSGQEKASTIAYVLWQALPDDAQAYLQERGLSEDALAPDAATTLIKTMNRLIHDHGLAQQVETHPSTLVPATRALLEKSAQDTLSEEEVQRLNRSLLDLSFGEAIDSPFILSDGTYLHNSLSGSQAAELVSVYEELLKHPDLSANSRMIYKKSVSDILQGRRQPSLRELETALSEALAFKGTVVATIDKSVLLHQTELQTVREELETLDKNTQLDLTALSRLHNQEERARRHLSLAHAEKRELELQTEALKLSIRQVEAPLRDRLFHLQAELDAWVVQGADGAKSSKPTPTPLIVHLDRQIELKEHYVDLLSSLQDSVEAKELESLAQDQEKLSLAIAHIQATIKESVGNEREALLSDLDRLQSKQHILVQRLESTFIPLRETVSAIAAEEEYIWATLKELTDTRIEILKITGTEGTVGSLEEKVQHRAELILTRATSDKPQKIVDGELRRLNEEIAAENLELSVLLQSEEQALSLLRTLSPERLTQDGLLNLQGDLAPLRNYVIRQDEILGEYQTLWTRHEIQRDISRQEEIILKQLQNIALAVEDDFLSESQTRDLSRYMQQVVRARRQLEENQRRLAALEAKSNIGYWESEARGFQLDSLALYQMEQALGLNLNKYRAAFEERKVLANNLQTVLFEKNELEHKKLDAARRRDQLEIDQLLPNLAAKETEIRELGKQLESVSNSLSMLAADYDKRLQRTQKFREQLTPQIDQLNTELARLHVNLIDNDQQLHSLALKILPKIEPETVQKSIFGFKQVDKLEELIAQTQEELSKLRVIRSRKQEDHYYKAKSLWLLGEALYRQSLIPEYGQLLASNSITADMLEDEQRHGLFPYEEYDPERLYTSAVIQDIYQSDGKQASYEAWLDSLEQTGLDLLLEELPSYTAEQVTQPHWIPQNSADLVADINAFIARSRFLAGTIHMKRAIRFLRTDRTSSIHDNRLAKTELDAATNTFLHFLDFAAPLEAHSQSQHLLSEKIVGGYEFPKHSRHPIRLLSQAQVYLGTIAFLKEDKHSAIAHFRDLLRMATDEVLLTDGIQLNAMGRSKWSSDPLIQNQSNYQSSIHPLYASLLAHSPVAHEALYRLGRSYQALAEDEAALAIEESDYYPARADEHDQRARDYTARAIAYYSQVILTQSYSPYRSAALLKRGLLYRSLGQYDLARGDLVCVLGSPQDPGGSWSPTHMTDKGDLPGELNPGYAHIAFELGRLHLEAGDYVAAADAFIKAKEGDPEDLYVLKAKIAYAKTLMESKQWLMAHVLLSELMSDRASLDSERVHLFHPDIILDLGRVNKELGNYQEGIRVLREVYTYAPPELLKGDQLDLDNGFALALLREDYRDSIRPLALASYEIAEISLLQRKYNQAHIAYQRAERLFRWLPWQEDRVLRARKRDAFEAFKDEYALRAKWGQHKTRAEELLYTSYTPYHQQMAQLRRSLEQLPPLEIQQTLEGALEEVTDLAPSFTESAATLESFYTTERARLPEVRELNEVRARRDRDRRMGASKSLRYDALLHIREAIRQQPVVVGRQLADQIHDLYSRDSIEDQLLDDFVAVFVRDLDLNEGDRARMRSGKGNIENLLTLTEADSRLVEFGERLMSWLESEMRLTGLDDIYIPLSPQAKILEEVDLYRVAVLAHLDDGEHYSTLRAITDHYLEENQEPTHRIGNPEWIWQLVQIAADASAYQEDWESSVKYHRFLQHPEQKHFFLEKGGDDHIRAQMALAQALIKIAERGHADALFVLDDDERVSLEIQANIWQKEATDILEGLTQMNSESTHAIATKSMAKELLQRL